MSRRPRHARRVATSTALAVAAVGLLAPPAGAYPRVTSCSALGGSVAQARVVGDLVVDLDACVLDDAVVTGDVIVEVGGRLGVWDSTIRGDLRASGDVDLNNATVSGAMVLTAPTAWIGINHSHVRRSVRGEADRVYLWNSTVGGAYDVVAHEIAQVSADSAVGGRATLRTGDVVLSDAAFRRGLSVTAVRRVAMCGTTIGGDLTVTGAVDVVEIGRPQVSPTDCAVVTADARVSIGGSLSVVDNVHDVRIDNVAVGGDLTCTGNTGPVGVSVGGGVTVGGVRSGQCV